MDKNFENKLFSFNFRPSRWKRFPSNAAYGVFSLPCVCVAFPLEHPLSINHFRKKSIVSSQETNDSWISTQCGPEIPWFYRWRFFQKKAFTSLNQLLQRWRQKWGTTPQTPLQANETFQELKMEHHSTSLLRSANTGWSGRGVHICRIMWNQSWERQI